MRLAIRTSARPQVTCGKSMAMTHRYGKGHHGASPANYPAMRAGRAFYPWLRKFAWEHLLKLHRRHLSDRRSVTREEQGGLVLPDDSALELAKHVVAPGTSPADRLLREELVGRVQTALALLPEGDREVL